MDFLSAGTKKVAVVERWLLTEVQLYQKVEALLYYQGWSTSSSFWHDTFPYVWFLTNSKTTKIFFDILKM